MHPYVSGPLQFSFIINRFDHSVSHNHLNRLSYYILLFKVFFLVVTFVVALLFGSAFLWIYHHCLVAEKKKTVALSINMTFI